MRRLCALIFILVSTHVTAQPEDDFWKSTVNVLSQETNIADLKDYDDGMEFFYFPSFRPTELIRIYRIKEQWYAVHSTVRRISDKTLFDESGKPDSMKQVSRIVLVDAKTIESIVSRLRSDSFYTFHDDESERSGFDGETFFFQYLKNGKKVAFYYWNVGLSIKYLQMNSIARIFRSISFGSD